MKRCITAIAALIMLATATFAGSGNKLNQTISKVNTRDNNFHWISVTGDNTMYFIDGNSSANKAFLSTALQAFQNGTLVDIYWVDLPGNPGLLKLSEIILHN